MAGDLKLTGKRRVEAYKMLHRVCKMLNGVQIPYVLEAGTLLGIIRENRLLPWDNDLDITVTDQYAKQLLQLKWKFRRMGYKMKVRTFKKDLGPFKKGMIRIVKVQKTKWFLFKSYSLMDIFIKYDMDNAYHWVVSTKSPVWKKCPKHFYDERVNYVFDEGNFWVPKDYEGYLAYHYGASWRIPKKEWDFRLDDFCEKTIL